MGAHISPDRRRSPPPGGSEQVLDISVILELLMVKAPPSITPATFPRKSPADPSNSSLSQYQAPGPRGAPADMNNCRKDHVWLDRR